MTLSLIILGAALAIAGIICIASAYGKTDAGPTCGFCGFNLTGATSNRCPECGKQFIDAGVITGTPATAHRRSRRGILLLLAGILAILLTMTWHHWNQARLARERAAIARSLEQALQRAPVPSTRNAPP